MFDNAPRDGEFHLAREYQSAKSAKRAFERIVDRIVTGDVTLPEGTTLDDWVFDWESARSNESVEVRELGGRDGYSALFLAYRPDEEN